MQRERIWPMERLRMYLQSEDIRITNWESIVTRSSENQPNFVEQKSEEELLKSNSSSLFSSYFLLI